MSQEQTILLRALIDKVGTSGGTYNPSGASIAAGVVTSFQIDSLGNLKVFEQYQPGYEDNTANRALVEARNTPYNISQSATISIIKSSPGFLHLVSVGMNSCPTTTIYDNASGASGTILAHIEPIMGPGSYVQDVTFVNGATAWVTAGNAVRVVVSAR